MKYQLGVLFMILGLILLGAFAFALSVYRFNNEKLTETQLCLWSLQRWWGWVIPAALSFFGMWLMAKSEKK